MSHSEAEVKNGGDLEAGSGAGLARQLSVQLTNDQFERLYLQPGGTAAKGDLSKRLGNPTALGISCFLLNLTPVSIILMNIGKTDTTSLVALSGDYYLLGGVGMVLAGLLEFIVGNSFPFSVFTMFGLFWLVFGFINQPIQNLTGAFEATGGAASPQFNQAIALYLLCWGLLVFIMMLASLRTNVVFFVLFLTLDVAFWLLVGGYYAVSNTSSNVTALFKAAGAFALVTCVCGWYLVINLYLGSTGFPFALPVGDLSGFLASGKRQT